MKQWRNLCVYLSTTMVAFIHFIIALGGLAAAAAVAAMCVVCLFVWLGGSEHKEPSQAWRQPDKS